MFRARTISEKTLQAAINGSGGIVSFESAFETPLSSLVVNISPVQSGSGDPSPTNIRPISGWTGAQITRTGKNFCPKLVAQSNAGMTLTVDENGVATLSGESTGVGQVIGPKSFYLTKGTYTITGGGNSNYSLRLYNEDTTNTIARLQSETASVTFTLVKLTRVRIFVRTDVVAEVSGLTFYPMIRLSTETDATYEPYNGDTYPIAWSDTAGTVYGGTLNPLNGKLTVDRVELDLGTRSWTRSTSYGNPFFYTSLPNRKGGKILTSLSSAFKDETNELNTSATFGNSAPNGSYALASGSAQMFIRWDDYTDAASFKAAVNGKQVVYPLATPIEYDIDPVTINTLLGQNNVWADTGDIASLKVDAVTGKLKLKLKQ